MNKLTALESWKVIPTLEDVGSLVRVDDQKACVLRLDQRVGWERDERDDGR